VLRAAGRTAVGSAALAIGVTGLTVLFGITALFRGAVVGTLLGGAVVVQVRAADFIAIAICIVLGTAAVIDVLYLDLRERASEYATLKAFGWKDSTMRYLVMTEGALIGTLGAVTGAAAGVGIMAFLGAGSARVVPWAALAAMVGIGLAISGSVLPAQMLRRRSLASLFAE
jgi:ABC-type antimicrobial peptide transport system permease subunit